MSCPVLGEAQTDKSGLSVKKTSYFKNIHPLCPPFQSVKSDQSRVC